MSFLDINNLKNPAIAGFFYVQDVRYIAGVRMRRSKFRTILAVALLVFVPISLVAAESYSAIYGVEADGISLGKLERILEQAEDGSFILKTKSYTSGFWARFIKDNVNEESRFTVVDGKVIPKSYQYIKQKKGRLFEEKVIFDSEKGIIFSTFVGDKKSFPFTGSECDKLLYQFRIRESLRRGERKFQFSVVDRMRIRSYEFEVRKLEKIDTPMGRIEVIQVERVNEVKRKTTLWFAPGLDYLPVRIVQDTGEHNFSSTIISASIK